MYKEQDDTNAMTMAMAMVMVKSKANANTRASQANKMEKLPKLYCFMTYIRMMKTLKE